MTLVLSLEEQEQSLIFAINEGARVIYWHHGVGQFRYMRGSDQGLFQQDMKKLRQQYRAGTFPTITVGDTLNLDGSDLYAMEVEIRDHQCFAYMLLGRRGDLGTADKTPYFFKSKVTRDKTIAYLTKTK